MIIFSWSGLKSNAFTSGKIAAPSLKEATSLLEKDGIHIIDIVPERSSLNISKGLLAWKKGRIKDQDLLMFTRKFSSMMEAGIAIVPALTILHGQAENPVLKEVLRDISEKINAGMPLSDALEKYPFFDTVYINLIRAGELSGSMDTFLKKIAQNIHKKIKIVRGLKSALTYPVIVLFVAFGVIAVMMIYVVPIFAGMFANANMELPAPTKLVMKMSDFFRSWAPVFVIGIIIAVMKLFQKMQEKNYALKVRVDKMKLNLPLVGRMMYFAMIARLSQVIANLVLGGTSLLDALSVAKNTISNSAISDALESVRKAIYEGKPFAEAMRKTEMFPETLCGFIEVGEQTGQLNDMLETVSIFYEDEFDTAVENFSQAIEPIMIVFLGVVISFILIAMYMPIFQMGSTV